MNRSITFFMATAMTAGLLSTKMADALLSFMRTGVPSAKGLPEWPAYDSENGATMYLNDNSQVMMAPDREALHLLQAR